MATYRGLGGLVASAVSRGPERGSQRLYLSYLYVGHTIDVVAVDPDTGHTKVFPNPPGGDCWPPRIPVLRDRLRDERFAATGQ